MIMGEWSRCAEGFAGVKKFNRICDKNRQFTNEDPNKIRSRLENGKGEPIETITCKDSPSHKKRKIWQNSAFKNKCRIHETNPRVVHQAWKSEAFFEDLKIAKEVSPQHSHEIECASSSSSDNESVPVGDPAGLSKKISSNTTRRKIEKQRKRSSNSCLSQSAKEFDLKSKTNPSQTLLLPENHSKNLSKLLTTHGMDSADKVGCTEKSIAVHTSWTVPSFEDSALKSEANCLIKQDAKPLGVKLVSHGTKLKVVRRLQKELNQDSQGFISDVESDSDEPDCYQTKDQPSVTSAKTACKMMKANFSDHQLRKEPKYLQIVDKISPASSPEEDGDEEETCPPGYTDSQFNISSESSCVSSASQTREKMKASDWVSVLQKQRTPVKDKDSPGVNLEDSGKKKKKYVSGSLADRLFRIQRRLKSSVRMWHHSSKTRELSDKESKSVTVLVKKVDQLMSLYLCECVIISDGERGKVCKAFFSMERAQFLSLRVGVAVQIYPPWQQLETAAGERTYLCTDFACVVPAQEVNTGIADVHQTNSQVEWLHLRAVWDCPCARVPHLSSSSCPAVKQPSTIYTHGQLVSPNSSNGPAQKQEPTAKGLARLQSVHNSSPVWSPRFLATSPSINAHRSGLVGRTLQDSKEMLRSADDRLPPFSATVLRVFVQRCGDNGSMIRNKVLLVDAAGTVAMATLPPQQPGCRNTNYIARNEGSDHDRYESLKLGQLEGQTCTCHGLMVSSRITSNQDSNLFNILESAWSSLEMSTSESRGQSQSDPDSISSWQDRDASQPVPSRLQVAPTFAYVLQAYTGYDGSHLEPHHRKHTQTSEQHLGRKEDLTQTLNMHGMFHWQSLSSALKNPSGERVVFVAQMTFCYSDENSRDDLNSVRFMVVYDMEVDNKGHSVLRTVHLRNQCFMGRLKPGVCLFRDVCYRKGQLECDQYSLVLPQSQWSAWGVECLLDTGQRSLATDLTVPPLTRAAAQGTVVCVQGRVSAVDEESACVIEECSVCGSDLIVPDAGPMHCTACNEDVAQSVTVLRMAGFLTCSNPGLTNSEVKVQFAQKTIEKILPAEADEDGYDVEQVIGKNVVCKACLVESNTVDRLQNRIFLQELEYT